jgi:hypothetical protein
MRAAGIIVVAALLLAGCGAGDEPARTPAPKASATAAPAHTGLMGALASVKAGEAAHKAFSWTDVAGVRKVAGYPDHTADLRFDDNRKTRWMQALGAGAEALGGDAFTLGKVGERLGFDYLSADAATSIGDPPRRAVRLDGVDSAAVADAARRLGAKEVPSNGHTILARRPEGKMDLDDPLSRLGVLSGANRIATDHGAAVLGGFDEPVDEALGHGTSLAAEPDYQAAAACLGDGALFAVIYPGSVAGFGGALVAVGARAEGENAVEVACEIGVPAGAADTKVAALRRSLGPDARTSAGVPMRQVGTLAEAAGGETAGRTWVRAAVRLNRPVGFFTDELVRHGLPQYFGE